jgi:hypothetical protein
MIIDKRICAGYPRLLLASRPSNGLLIQGLQRRQYEPKQDPGGWLVVYTTAARATRETEDVMMAYLSVVLG